MLKFIILPTWEKAPGNSSIIDNYQKPHCRLGTDLRQEEKRQKRYFQCHAMLEHQLTLPVPAFNGLPGLWFEDTEPGGRVSPAEDDLNENSEGLMFADLSA